MNGLPPSRASSILPVKSLARASRQRYVIARPNTHGGKLMPIARQSLIAAHVTTVSRSISALDRALGQLSASMGHAPANRSSSRARRKLTLSPARRAALKLQGQYMGYIRNLTPKQKAQVKALKVKKGMRPAIAWG